MFTGTHLRTLDAKKRIAIPKVFRDLLTAASPRIFLAPETAQSLSIYPAYRFEERAQDLRQRVATEPQNRIYLRLYYSQAEGVELDKQGRIRIPDRLLEFAGLAQEIVLLGIDDHIEVWDTSRWEAFLTSHGPSFDQVAENI